MAVKLTLAASIVALAAVGSIPTEVAAFDNESDTVRVTRELDRHRADRARTLERRDRARESALSRQRERRDARREADIQRRSRLTAEPSNRLTDRLYFRPEPLGKAARPR